MRSSFLVSCLISPSTISPFHPGQTRQPSSVLDWMFIGGDAAWANQLAKRIKTGLHENHKRPLDEAGSELLAFFEFVFALHYHDMSPTVMTDPRQEHNFGPKRLLTLTRFEEFLKALSSGAPQNEDGWVPPHDKLKVFRKSLANLGEQLQEVAFCKGASVVSLDDDKLRHHSKESKDLDVKVGFVRGGKKSPTMVAAVSKHTDVLLSGHLVHGEETTHTVAKKVLALSVGADDFSGADLRGVSVSADRGLFTSELAQALSVKGAHVSGTVMPRKSAQNNPFKVIPAAGTSAAGDGAETYLYEIYDGMHSRSASWAIGADDDEDNNGQSTVNLLAYRQDNGKIIYLATTDPELAANKFVLTTSSRSREHLLLTYHDDVQPDEPEGGGEAKQQPAARRRLNPEPQLSAVKDYFDQNGLLELTEGQGDAIWFLLRRFRFTSYVVGTILRVIYHSYPDFSRPSFLNGAAERVRRFLEYDEHEPFIELPDNLAGATLATIKQLCRARGITGYSKVAKSGPGKAILENILAELREWEAPVDLDHHIKVAFFKAWFLVSTGSSKAMKLGLLNEPNVLRGLRSFMIINPSFTDSVQDEWTIKLQLVQQCGIVVRVEEMHMGTSADGIIVLDIQCSSMEIADGEYILPVEIKTRSGESELKFAHSCPPFSVLRLDLDGLSPDNQAALFREYIPSHDNRVQLLHHALVYKAGMVLFVEASKDSIIRTVLIVFSNEVLVAYADVLNALTDKHLDWIYSPGAALPRFERSELGNVGELHTLQQNLDLWNAAQQIIFDNDNKPFGYIITIVPAVVEYWNATKGGVDNGLSRYLANVHASPYRVIHFEAVLWDRVIMIGLLNAYALSKWDRLSDVQITSCNSFAQLKKISQRDFTFKLFLSEAMKHFRSKSEAARNPTGGVIQALVDTSVMTRGQKIDYYNTPAGRARRGGGPTESHRLIKVPGQHKCMVCMEHSNVHFSCQSCSGMYFCSSLIDNHPKHPDSCAAGSGFFTSCRDVFHDSRFTLSTSDA
jgi:hypothetical protein